MIKLISIRRNQNFTVSIIALAQGGIGVATEVTAILNSAARLKLGQIRQTLSNECTTLTYSISSSSNTEQVILYPEGPCHANGQARVVIDVTLEPCPTAFVLSNEECICEERLRGYGVNCTDHKIMTRVGLYKMWLGVLYHENGSYQGLIIYRKCPPQYCRTEDLAFSLDDPDSQCDHNRTGVLCGACGNGSLMLGGSRCQVCRNTSLTHLIFFAAAGIALVVFLSLSRLTVATGMINAVILYANIIQVNRKFFFP